MAEAAPRDEAPHWCEVDEHFESIVLKMPPDETARGWELCFDLQCKERDKLIMEWLSYYLSANGFPTTFLTEKVTFVTWKPCLHIRCDGNIQDPWWCEPTADLTLDQFYAYQKTRRWVMRFSTVITAFETGCKMNRDAFEAILSMVKKRFSKETFDMLEELRAAADERTPK